MAAGLKLTTFICLALIFSKLVGVPGIALADCFAFTGEAIFLLWIFSRRIDQKVNFLSTLPKSILGAVISGGVTLGGVILFSSYMRPIFSSTLSMIAGGLVALPFIWKEVKLLSRL